MSIQRSDLVTQHIYAVYSLWSFSSIPVLDWHELNAHQNYGRLLRLYQVPAT